MSDRGPDAPPTLRLRRSVLFMPGSNARALAKARELPSDGVIMDLEDGVAPESKAVGRDRVVAALAAGGYGRRELIVRVNSLDTPWGLEDLAAVAGLPLDGVLFPKMETPARLRAAVQALDAAGAPPTLPVWIMIETPRGVLQAEPLCGAHARLAVVVMGTSDLANDLRARHTAERLGMLAALSWCVLAARSHGLDALDGVQLDLEDEEALRRVCSQGRDLGFDGKTLIHPRQIAVANEVFGPGADDIAAARRVCEASARARARGSGVVVVDGRLVEQLHVAEAERTLALARAIERT